MKKSLSDGHAAVAAHRLTASSLALSVALLTVLVGARGVNQGPGASLPDQYPNFDIRSSSAASAVAYMNRQAAPTGRRTTLATAGAAGTERLQRDFPTIEIVNSRELGTPEVVRVAPGTGFLTASSTDRVGSMRTFLSTYADVYGLSQGQVTSLRVVADSLNPAGNMAWVELEQQINGLPVFRGAIRGGFTARGELATTTGQLAVGIEPSALPTVPVLTASQAVSRAAADVGWRIQPAALEQKGATDGRVTFARGPMADDAKASLLYFPLGPGVARLAWANEIWGDPNSYLVVVDAEDGTVLFRKNLTSFQSRPATYVVYADDSPAPMSPSTVLPGSGAQAAFIARTAKTLVGNESPNTFNNLGWMTDGTNSTIGNNIEAGIDRAAPDGIDAPVVGVNRVFDFAYNPQTDDPLTPAYQNGEVTDVFYWANIYHDRLYSLGFTESFGNFQSNNFGRGGKAGDPISVETQDGSGTNNANYCCPNNGTFPPDGSRARVQMYIWTGPTPNRSSGLDHEVLLHELTHGVSSRLHADGAGLTSSMARGLGEGWSDFYARALLSTADEVLTDRYANGAWVSKMLTIDGRTNYDNYYYGERRFPYSLIRSVGGPDLRPYNPLTFADADANRVAIDDGAFVANPIWQGVSVFEPHMLGEIWASALFEVRARLIERLGFEVGNQRILQLVTDGMMGDPADPTFLDARDSIVAAANASGSAADVDDVRAGFASRGLGVRAQIRDLTGNSATILEDFYPTEPSFTDTLTAGSSLIKAVYVTELRDRIAALRNVAVLTPFAWTRTLTPQVSTVRAVDITELRQALDEAYDAASEPRPVYSTTPAIGASMRAADISELREAVLSLESAGGCLATTILRGQPGQLQALTEFRGLRDHVLLSTELGRTATSSYYRHSPEVIRLASSRPGLAIELVALANQLRPIAQQMQQPAAQSEPGEQVTIMTAALIDRIETVLDQLQAIGSPALVADLTRLRKQADLRSAVGRTSAQYWRMLVTRAQLK